MNGKEAILQKIELNAKVKSEEILKVAQAEADQILLAAKEKAQKIADTGAVSAKLKADTLYENKMTVAGRQSKNAVLLAKQKILDEIFAEAHESIANMKADEYKKFFGTLIIKYGESGDSIVPGKEDKKLFTQDFITGLTANSKIKLTLGKEAGNFEKGVFLSSNSCDKNLSLDMILREVRENLEAAVAKLCFEVK